MLLPQNHERIQTISELFREDMDRHEMEGGHYYDEKAGELAALAIKTLMPHLVDMQQTRVVVEADKGLLIEGEAPRAYEGVHVEATLERVAIQALMTRVGDDTLNMYDLFAVFRPHYTDPEPDDLVFGNELFVPFADISKFEQAA